MTVEVLKNDVLAVFNEGAATWDAELLCKAYWDDAVFFGLRVEHSIGNDAIKHYFASYADILNGAKLALVEQQIRPLGPDAFLAQGFGDFTYEMADGSVTRNRLRTTLGIQRRNSVWKIALHHFSPIPAEPSYGH